MEENHVTTRRIGVFRDAAFIGALYSIGRGKKVRLLKKNRYTAMTDKGSYQWVDLYMHNVKRRIINDTSGV